MPVFWAKVKNKAVVPDEDDELRLREGAGVVVIAHVDESDVTLGKEDWLALDCASDMAGANLRGDQNHTLIEVDHPQRESVLFRGRITSGIVICADATLMHENTEVVVVGRDEDIWCEITDAELLKVLDRAMESDRLDDDEGDPSV